MEDRLESGGDGFHIRTGSTGLSSPRASNYISLPHAGHFRMPYHIAVTGANGRVGSAFIRLALSEGHSILALDLGPTGHPPDDISFKGTYTYAQVNGVDFDAYKASVEQAGCDAIVHLAAIYNLHSAENGTHWKGGHVRSNGEVLIEYRARLTAPR